jgi:hypothetical protein
MRRIAFVFGIAILSVCGMVEASTTYSTDFSGTTLDSRLTAAGPTGSLVALDGNGGLQVFTSADGVTGIDGNFWDTVADGPRVTCDVGSRDFTLETVVKDWTHTNIYAQTGIVLIFDNAPAVFGLAANSTSGSSIVSESSVNSETGSWGCADVASTSIMGSNVNVGLKVVREGNDYTFSYRLGSSGDWVSLSTWTNFNTSATLESVGLGSKAFANQWYGPCISNATFDSMSLTVVPEPSTLALVLGGFAGLLAYAWRKRK